MRKAEGTQSNLMEAELLGPFLCRRLCFHIDKSNMSSYPSDALPFDSSVRCVIDHKLRGVLQHAYGTDVDHVCGIIQGVAVDGSNHVVYYDVGRNMSPKQFFLAADVSAVMQHAVAPAPAPAAATVEPKVVVVLPSDEDAFEDDKPRKVGGKKDAKSFASARKPVTGASVQPSLASAPKLATGASDQPFGTLEDANAALAASGWRRCKSKEGPNIEHDEYEVVHTPRDGNCLFHCFAAIVMDLGLLEKCTQADMRKRIGLHWRQNNCAIECDSTYGNGEETFTVPYTCQNVTGIERGKYGALPEIAAFCQIYSVTIIVFSPETQERGAPGIVMNPGHPHPKMVLQTLAWNSKGERERGRDYF
jgi:hypothetical protein